MSTHSAAPRSGRGRSLLFVWSLVGLLAVGFLGMLGARAQEPDDDASPTPSADPSPSADPDPVPSVRGTDDAASGETEPTAGPDVLGVQLSASGQDMTGLTIIGISLIALGVASYGLSVRASRWR